MEQLTISSRLFSDVVWKRIFENAAPRLVVEGPAFFREIEELDALRSRAEYNTGSIPAASAWLLYALTFLFRPSMVIEIGTFIGKSTVSMAKGMDEAGIADGMIHTCDYSNDIAIPAPGKTKIVQYPKQSSTEMLTAIRQAHQGDGLFEMIHVDGRLQDEDLALLGQLCSDRIVFALDDFEGCEKGVANYAKLRESGLIPQYILVNPPSEELVRSYGLLDYSTTALLISPHSIGLTAQ